MSRGVPRVKDQVMLHGSLLLLVLAGEAVGAPNQEVQVLLQKAQGDSAGERTLAFRRLAELDSARETPRLIPRLEGLDPSQAEAGALLAWWLARPYGATAAATGAWVVKVLADSPPAGPGALPRLAPRGPKEQTLGIAARLLAARPHAKEAQQALLVLLLYPDEEVARSAAAGLSAAEKLEVQLGPFAVQALALGDPVLESRAQLLLAQHPDPKITAELLLAAEGAAGRGTSAEYLRALQAVTGQKLPNVAAYRDWWSKRASRR